MGEVRKYPGKLVFGLDIGTRSVVGTVGYKTGDQFYVVAQRILEHETRAMLDGLHGLLWGILLGTAYLVVNKDIRKAWAVLFLMFVL